MFSEKNNDTSRGSIELRNYGMSGTELMLPDLPKRANNAGYSMQRPCAN